MEQVGDRPVLEDLVDSLREQRGDRQHGRLLNMHAAGHGQAVSQDDLFERGCVQPVGGRARQDRVGGCADHPLRAVLE